MNQAGFVVRRGVRLGFDGPRARLVDAVTGHALRDHLTKQYVVAGTREVPVRQGTVEWLIERDSRPPRQSGSKQVKCKFRILSQFRHESVDRRTGIWHEAST